MSTLRVIVAELGNALGQPVTAVLGVPVAIDLRAVATEHGQFVSGVPADLVARVHDAFDASRRSGTEPAYGDLTKLERANALRARFALVAGELEGSLARVPDAGVLLAALDGEPTTCAGLLDDVFASRQLVGRFLLDAGDEFDDERIDQLGDGYVRSAAFWSALAARPEPELVHEIFALENSCREWMQGASALPTRYAF